jgi:hypothetical protein
MATCEPLLQVDLGIATHDGNASDCGTIVNTADGGHVGDGGTINNTRLATCDQLQGMPPPGLGVTANGASASDGSTIVDTADGGHAGDGGTVDNMRAQPFSTRAAVPQVQDHFRPALSRQSVLAYSGTAVIALFAGALITTRYISYSRALAGLASGIGPYCYLFTTTAYGDCAPRWIWVLLVAVEAGANSIDPCTYVEVHNVTANATRPSTSQEAVCPRGAAVPLGAFGVLMAAWTTCGFRRGAPTPTAMKWGSLFLVVMLEGLLTPLSAVFDLDHLICPNFFLYGLTCCVAAPFLAGILDGCTHDVIQHDGFYMSVLLYMVFSSPFAVQNFGIHGYGPTVATAAVHVTSSALFWGAIRVTKRATNVLVYPDFLQILYLAVDVILASVLLSTPMLSWEFVFLNIVHEAACLVHDAALHRSDATARPCAYEHALRALPTPCAGTAWQSSRGPFALCRCGQDVWTLIGACIQPTTCCINCWPTR